MTLAAFGFSSRNLPRYSPTSELTMPSTSLLPSLVLVWPSNCGWGTRQRDDGGEAFAEVFAGGDEVFEEVCFLAVVVDASGSARCGSRRGACRLRSC